MICDGKIAADGGAGEEGVEVDEVDIGRSISA